MLQTSTVNFTDQDNSFEAPNVLSGISAVKGVTERGPVDDPSIVLTSPSDYYKYYGGELPNTDFPTICLRHLSKGGKLRVSSTRHYTDPTDASTLTALRPGLVAIKEATNSALTVFSIYCKYPGAKYNDLKVEIAFPSNGQAGYFNLRIYIAGDLSNTLETYDNLRIEGNPNVQNSKYLDRVIQDSALVGINYADLSGTTAQLSPLPGVSAFTGGSNGGAIVAQDYIGSSTSGIGLYSFDPYDDMFAVAVPEMYDPNINQAGAIYADTRKDIMFFAHLDHRLKTDAALISARSAVTVDTKYIAFYSGGVKIKDPITLMNRDISEIGDVLLIASRVAQAEGPWYSFANWKRGSVNDAIGVTSNFGSAGDYNKLNNLAKRQINMMIARNGRTYISGNFTGQFRESKASYINIVMLLIFTKKTLRPILESYLEDPLDIELFRAIYRDVKPILDSVRDKRGLYNYIWDGDQDAPNISQVRVNTIANINQGIYKVKLGLEPINGLVLADVTISLNRAGELTIDLEETI